MNEETLTALYRADPKRPKRLDTFRRWVEELPADLLDLVLAGKCKSISTACRRDRERRSEARSLGCTIEEIPAARARRKAASKQMREEAKARWEKMTEEERRIHIYEHHPNRVLYLNNDGYLEAAMRGERPWRA